MQYYEKLYDLKDDKKFVQRYLNDLLLFQIYSPEILHQAYISWPELPWFIKKNIPQKVHDLIENSPYVSDKSLQSKLNEYHVCRAVNVLSAYQACDTPMTQDETVPQNRYKLTSKKGDKALIILQNALKEKHFSDKVADLAIRTGHKFLSEDQYYISWNLPKKFASMIALPVQLEGETETNYMFPTIQLTKGCLNHCSHCDSCAEPHLSQMPWPIFRTLYRNLNRYYRHYPQKKSGYYFASFFADSDMLDYYDPIMDVDSGDVGLWIKGEKEYCQYLTRGVKNEQNKLALAKTLVSGQPVAISFVDTPQENMPRNIKQLNETLDVVESVPERAGNPSIIHAQLKSGPTVDKKVFRDFPIESKLIHALGRAKNFPKDETESWPDESWIPKLIFQPSGDLVWQEVKNGDTHWKKGHNLLESQHGPKISPVRLFIRRHILSRFK